MVISFSENTEQALEEFLNTGDPELVYEISDKYSGELYFLSVETDISYDAGQDQYVAYIRQEPSVNRVIAKEGEYHTSKPELKANNGYLKTDREWEESTKLYGLWSGTVKNKLNVGFDEVSKAKGFIENQLDLLQDKLESVGEKYDKASEYKGEELVFTRENRSELDSDKIVIEKEMNRDSKENEEDFDPNEDKSLWNKIFR